VSGIRLSLECLLPAPRVPIRNKLWISPKCIRSRELFGSKLAPEPGLRVAKRGQTTFSGDSRAGQRDNVLRGPQRFDQRRRKVHHAVAPEVGFEPTTNRLTADRSTTELLWNRFHARLSGVELCPAEAGRQVIGLRGENWWRGCPAAAGSDVSTWAIRSFDKTHFHPFDVSNLIPACAR